MKVAFNLDKGKKYLLGVSGGSDSMALLDMAIKQGYKTIVCFVNYKLRTNADKEEALVKEYCDQNNITIYCLYPKMDKKENFEKWAREVRYEFYREVYIKEECDALLLGHQMDDNLENYLMALERNSVGWGYGIRKESYHHNMKIIRPLLSIRKRETREYCLGNNVPFRDDESNFSDDYTRNRIRHHIVEPASKRQIDIWLKEIEDYNKELDNKLSYLLENYDMKFIFLEKYHNEKKNLRLLLLRYMISIYRLESVNEVFVEDIDRKLMTSKNGVIEISKNHSLYYEYGVFYICKQNQDFEIVYDKLCYETTEYYSLSSLGETIESVYLTEEDFPITIRNYREGDSIELRFGTKKINRFFIDRKILHCYRKCWPVIVNKAGKVVYVKGLGCDINHFSTNANLFMVK